MVEPKVLTAPPKAADERLSYGKDPNQFGDLRLARHAKAPAPLAICFHGGFWRAQYDLTHLGHLCGALADAGLASFSVEYRRLGQPGGGYPGTCEDARDAVAFALELGKKFPQIDTTRVVLLGHSAGGHLALWAAKGAAVKGVVALAAVSDVALCAERGLSGGVAREFAGAVPPDDARVSPLARLPLGVPQTLIHGDADDIVPVEMSRGYVKRAREFGDPATLVELPGIGHFELIDPETQAFQAVPGAVRRLA